MPLKCMYLLILSTLFFLSTASACPISLGIDYQCDNAVLIAEVEVLYADLAQDFGSDASIKVRVTDNQERIYKGFDKLSQTLNLKAWKGGSYCESRTLYGLIGKGPILIVVSPDQEIILMGVSVASKDLSQAYELNGWYDGNGIWYKVGDKVKDFGYSVSRGEWNYTWHLTADELNKRYSDQCEQFHVLTTLFLTNSQPFTIEPHKVLELITMLSSDDSAVRESAQQELCIQAAFQIPLLLELEKTSEPEACSRIRSILHFNLLHKAAFDNALKLRKSAASDQARFLLRTYASIRLNYRAKLPATLNTLRDLALKVSPSLSIPENADEDAIIKSWRIALN